jgi:hypothetical protein
VRCLNYFRRAKLLLGGSQFPKTPPTEAPGRLCIPEIYRRRKHARARLHRWLLSITSSCSEGEVAACAEVDYGTADTFPDVALFCCGGLGRFTGSGLSQAFARTLIDRRSETQIRRPQGAEVVRCQKDVGRSSMAQSNLE